MFGLRIADGPPDDNNGTGYGKGSPAIRSQQSAIVLPTLLFNFSRSATTERPLLPFPRPFLTRGQESGVRGQGWKGAAALRASGPHPMSKGLRFRAALCLSFPAS